MRQNQTAQIQSCIPDMASESKTPTTPPRPVSLFGDPNPQVAKQSRNDKRYATRDVVAKPTSSRPRSEDPKLVLREQILHLPAGADSALQWPWPKGYYEDTADGLTERNRKQSPLLRLPAELRLAIYDLAMGGELIQIQDIAMAERPKQTANLDFSAAYGPDMEIFDPKSKTLRPANELLGLRYVCRQTRAETRLQFFKENSFGGRFEMHFQDLKEVPQAFTVEQRACAKEVFFRICSLACLSNIKPVTNRFPNFERVVILQKPTFVNSVGFGEYEQIKKKVRDALGRDVELLLDFDSSGEAGAE